METQKKTCGTSQSKPRQMASKTCANNLRVSYECRVKKLFTAVLPKRVFKTHTPCIHYHLRDKSHRSHHGFIKRARQTPSLLTLSPFPSRFSSLAFSASFLLSDLFPSSSISWAMLAVSISFFNLDLIGCHVFNSWFDIRSGHIYFQGQYFLYFSPFVWSILLVMLIALVAFVFNSFLVIIFSFCSRSRDFSLTWESNSLSDYRRVRLLSLKARLFLCCPHSTTLSFRLQLPSFSIYPSDGSREWYFRWLRFFYNLIERL